MDIDNIKLPWDQILESYISHYEKLRPDLDVRAQMSPIISDLNNNRIRSRSIMSAGKPVCYAFYVSPESMSDRYYGMVGFVSPEDYNQDRLKNIIQWLVDEAARDGKILMFNEIFNGSDYDDILGLSGMNKMERVMLELDIPENFSEESSADENVVKTKNIGMSDVPDLIELHEMAYAGSEDQILESTKSVERKKFWISLFDGRAFGRFIQNSSLWAIVETKHVGAIVTTLADDKPLIVDLFTVPEMRNRGYGTFLIRKAASILKEMGYNSVTLWVTRTNPAIEIYKSLGFREVDGKVETIFFKSV